MTHVFHNGLHALLLTPDELNNLIVSVERGRLFWNEQSHANISNVVTTGVTPNDKLCPAKRVEGATGNAGITFEIAQFYKEVAEIAEVVKPILKEETPA